MMLDMLKSCLPPIELNRMEMVCKKPIKINKNNVSKFLNTFLNDLKDNKLMLKYRNPSDPRQKAFLYSNLYSNLQSR